MGRRAFLLLPVLLALPLIYHYARPLWVPVYQAVVGKRTVNDVIDTHGTKAKANLEPYFVWAGVVYPPESIVLLATKKQRQLELWAESAGSVRFIRSYSIQAASGVVGPKLYEGDRQVPEGIYDIEYLNPNSRYHLSMKLNYPNAFDRLHAQAEGRNQPGSDIFIHGKAVSIGCLAMGDEAIEELFTLVATIGRQNVQVIIAPDDPRREDILPLAEDKPDWVKVLYEQISDRFSRYRRS